jgi:hypothetical protein
VNPALFAGALAAPFLFEALPALATGELRMMKLTAAVFGVVDVLYDDVAPM